MFFNYPDDSTVQPRWTTRVSYPLLVLNLFPLLRLSRLELVSVSRTEPDRGDPFSPWQRPALTDQWNLYGCSPPPPPPLNLPPSTSTPTGCLLLAPVPQASSAFVVPPVLQNQPLCPPADLPVLSLVPFSLLGSWIENLLNSLYVEYMQEFLCSTFL